METVDGEIYLGLHHPERDEEMHVWFDEQTGTFLRGYVNLPNGDTVDLPTYESVEAALLGVGW